MWVAARQSSLTRTANPLFRTGAGPPVNQSTPRARRSMLGDVDDDDLEVALFARMRWNAPLSPEHADLLMDWLDLRPGLRVADLGCAWGELLMRVVARAARAGSGGAPTSGIGVDIDAAALARGREQARQRGLDGQVEFVEADASSWQGTTDR